MENANQFSNPKMSVPSPEELGTGRVSHAETSLLWRMARRVLNDGHPAAANVLVEIPLADGTFPLLGMTLTKKKRLICWGVLPPDLRAGAEAGKLRLTDHVTIELPNRTVHVTSYGEGDTVQHDSRGWRLISYPENNLSFAFAFATRLASIRNQVLETYDWIRMPTKDVRRRIKEFEDFPKNLTRARLTLPAEQDASGDWILACVYLADVEKPKPSPKVLPPLKEWADEFVEGWPDEQRYPMMPNPVRVGEVPGVPLVICVGVAPGHLREESFIFSIPNGGHPKLPHQCDVDATHRPSDNRSDFV